MRAQASLSRKSKNFYYYLHLRGLHLHLRAVSVLTAWLFFCLAHLSAQSATPADLGTLVSNEGIEPANIPAAPVASPAGDQEPAATSKPKADDPKSDDDADGKQTKRILLVIPNYRSVSANTTLPPQSTRQKFILATQDSFDYSSFLLAGALAGVGQIQNSYPEFHQGAAGYARYYWHSFADQADGNYFTEAIVPTLTRQDPRYYTLGHGGFFRRTGYAVSRLLVTRNDSGGETFNFSEIVGNGAGAGVSDLYYPSRERTWTKTGQKWVTQVGLDGVFNAFKEFWPDINNKIFHRR